MQFHITAIMSNGFGNIDNALCMISALSTTVVIYIGRMRSKQGKNYPFKCFALCVSLL